MHNWAAVIALFSLSIKRTVQILNTGSITCTSISVQKGCHYKKIRSSFIIFYHAKLHASFQLTVQQWMPDVYSCGHNVDICGAIY